MSGNHEVERFENLMYNGCEPHWHCIHCDNYWPFHCYGRRDLEQMKCPARNEKKQMLGREKVVSEFERCIGLFSPADKSDEYFICVCKRALELLKEQEAVKPIVDQCALPLTMYTVQFIKKYYCGICNEEITGKNVYCHKCGRKVKWDD